MNLASLSGDALHRQIEIDREEFFRHAGNLVDYRAYAKGEQEVTLTDEQKEMLEGLVNHRFCDNVIHQIISEDSDRLDLKRFDCPDDRVRRFLNEHFWVMNTLDEKSGETHYNALRDGDYCVMVDWDNDRGRVVVLREPWWDGTTGVYIAYDSQGQAIYAVKEWPTLTAIRRTVWFDDQILRFESVGGQSWLPYPLPEDSGWPQPRLRDDGRPLHIPFVHFANASRSSTGNYGSSEASGGMLASQDLLNDSRYDLAIAARFTGYQQMYMTGMKLETDPKSGKKIRPKMGPGFVHHSEESSARIGTLPAGSLAQLIDQYMTNLQAMARMSRTPLHLITGSQWPSGLALIRSEMPLIGKVSRQIKKFSPKWAEVGHRAVELQNEFGQGFEGNRLDEDATTAPVTVKYAPAEKYDPVTMAMGDKAFWEAAAAAQAVGVTLRFFLKKQGWSDEQMEGLPDSTLDSIDPQGRLQAHLQQAASSGSSTSLTAPIEVPH